MGMNRIVYVRNVVFIRARLYCDTLYLLFAGANNFQSAIGKIRTDDNGEFTGKDEWQIARTGIAPPAAHSRPRSGLAAYRFPSSTWRTWVNETRSSTWEFPVPRPNRCRQDGGRADVHQLSDEQGTGVP